MRFALARSGEGKHAPKKHQHQKSSHAIRPRTLNCYQFAECNTDFYQFHKSSVWHTHTLTRTRIHPRTRVKNCSRWARGRRGQHSYHMRDLLSLIHKGTCTKQYGNISAYDTWASYWFYRKKSHLSKSPWCWLPLLNYLSLFHHLFSPVSFHPPFFHPSGWKLRRCFCWCRGRCSIRGCKHPTRGRAEFVMEQFFTYPLPMQHTATLFNTRFNILPHTLLTSWVQL